MATGYSRVYDTVVSGSNLLSALKGEQVRDLEFASAVNNNNTILCASGYTLSAEDLIEASVRDQLIWGGASGGITGWLDLGPDAASQAQAYIRLFNFQTSDTSALTYRVLSFALASGVSEVVNLKNTAGGTTYVTVTPAQGAAAATGKLFNQGDHTGEERVVFVRAINLASGSEHVDFIIGSSA